MEWNGLNFNVEEAKKTAEKLRTTIGQCEEQLRNVAPSVPINFDSPEHISAFLYGGTISEDTKEMVGVFLSGPRAGEPKFRRKEIIHQLPRQVSPLERTELKKAGCYSTDESILRQLKGIKPIRDLLLKRSKSSKELDYMQGLPSLIDEMDWDILHPSYNQCVAATGRLSSSRPNAQNLTDSINKLIESKYDT